MKKGEVKKAERIALNIFDKWNNVTGFLQEDSGYYYELQSIIEDAVHVGIQSALKIKIKYEKDGNVIKEK